MKEKLKKILKWILNKWWIFAEIGVVIWAINGMWRVITFQFFRDQPEKLLKLYGAAAEEGTNLFLMPLLFYFLSAILILYLLRKYERKNQRG